MSTTTTETTTDIAYERNYAVAQDHSNHGAGRFVVVLTDGTTLKDADGNDRYFATPNSARKAITRLRRPTGDRHR